MSIPLVPELNTIIYKMINNNNIFIYTSKKTFFQQTYLVFILHTERERAPVVMKKRLFVVLTCQQNKFFWKYIFVWFWQLLGWEMALIIPHWNTNSGHDFGVCHLFTCAFQAYPFHLLCVRFDCIQKNMLCNGAENNYSMHIDRHHHPNLSTARHYYIIRF